MVDLYLKSRAILIVVFIIFIFNITQAFSAQEEVIRLSKQVRDNELQLAYLESNKDLLEAKINFYKEKIFFYRKTLANNLISLYKISYLPLKYIFLQNTPKENIILSYSLFNYYVRYVSDEITKAIEYIKIYKNNSEELKKIERQIVAINKDLSGNMEKIQKHLSKLAVDDKTKLLKYNSRLIKDSNDIAILIKNVSHQNFLQTEIQEDKNIEKEKGNFVWPAVGFIEKNYQESQSPLYHYGIILLTKNKSQIISPFDGEIAFVDNVENFDNLIVIRHSPSLYSILSGSFTSFVKPTQLVKKHEPIAIHEDTKVSAVYFEMRYKNTTIDPKIWLEIKKHNNIHQ